MTNKEEIKKLKELQKLLEQEISNFEVLKEKNKYQKGALDALRVASGYLKNI